MKSVSVILASLIFLGTPAASEENLFPVIDTHVERALQHINDLIEADQIVFNGSYVREQHLGEREVSFTQDIHGNRVITIRFEMLCGFPTQHADTEIFFLDMRLDREGNLTRLLPSISPLGSRTPCENLETAESLTGFWKTDCENNFGIRIEALQERDLYSINFCGPGGCSEDGQWRPLSPIRGDSAYELNNAALTIHGDAGSTVYMRCHQQLEKTITNRSRHSGPAGLHSDARRAPLS